MISVLLLAAGASRRMGQQDKLALSYQGQPMLLHTIRQLLASEIEELIIIRSTADPAFLPEDLKGTVKLAVNPHPERGMTSSIQAGLPHVNKAATGIMIALADMPLLQKMDYDRIIAAFSTAAANHPFTIAVPFYRGQKGNPVIFGAGHRQALMENPFPEGGREIIKTYWEKLLRVEMDSPRILFDVDTPEDWERVNEF